MFFTLSGRRASGFAPMISLTAELDQLSRYCEALSRPLLNAAALIVVFLIGFVDYLTGYEIELAIFYMGPIAVASWFTGRKSGLFIATASTAVILLANMGAGKASSETLIWLWNILAVFGFYLVAVFSLSSLKDTLEKERLHARTDSLTGAINSGHFKFLVYLEIERCRRYQRPFTFAYIDCDNFKLLNDRFGHHVGDEMLILVAQLMRDNVRKTDIVARLGGDEFGVLLPETGEQQGLAAIQKIRTMLLDAVRRRDWPITLSIGVVTYLRAPSVIDDVIRSADRLMYKVKKSGKDNLLQETHHAF
jgi:diguanylate cyclase (GGDEF)-like protein